MHFTIGYLYGDLMNIYGDTGNIIALKQRAEWRGIDVEVKNISVGDVLKPGDIDIFFFGGGQDQQQELVAQNLAKSGKGKVIRYEIERGVPLLSICGGYQLLGDYYQPHNAPKLPGVGIFPAYTKASHKRMIGNIVIRVQGTVNSEQQNKKTVTCNLSTVDYLVGFENHSGQTFLKEGAVPLGKVIKGFGNNGGLPAMQDGKALQAGDKTEGCVYKNAIGCYMHGSLLPKNPALADWFLKTALEVKYQKQIDLKPLDDELEIKAHDFAVKKFS